MQTIEEEILPELESLHGVTTNLSGLSEQSDAFLNDARMGLIFCLTGIFLNTGVDFQQLDTTRLSLWRLFHLGWSGRSMVTLFGDVPLSMFTVVGVDRDDRDRDQRFNRPWSRPFDEYAEETRHCACDH